MVIIMKRADIRCGQIRAGAFTLVEVLVAVAILALTIGTSIVSLTQLNKAAQSSRLYTGAQAVAQNHLDDTLNADWNGLLSDTREPRAPLSLGTHYVVPNTDDEDGDGLVAYYDRDEGGIPYSYSDTPPGTPNVPIYEEDPTSNDSTTVMGIVSVESSDAAPVGASYKLRQIDVSVAYTHDGRARRVELTTLRTTN